MNPTLGINTIREIPLSRDPPSLPPSNHLPFRKNVARALTDLARNKRFDDGERC